MLELNADANAWINRAATRLWTFTLGAVSSFCLTLSAYLEAFRATRLCVVLVALLLLSLASKARFIWRREFILYASFVAYMAIALLWTRDIELALNTLVPAFNCILIMVLFASMVSFNYAPAVFLGCLFGFGIGAAFYTLTQGFPFSYPQEFSYNAIAGMYLFGLFLTFMCSCFTRARIWLLGTAFVIMLHIVATTSIKTNLGIVLGLVSAAIMYPGHFARLLRRNILILAILLGALGFVVASNDSLMEKMEHGVDRVLVGVKVLQARDDVSGYSAFEKRDYWKQVGLEGWSINPIFGYGTEAFRDDFGITSHSTPIDLLYNYGVIGLILFYSVFASLAWRLLKLDVRRVSGQRSLMVAAIVCYAFVSLSGTFHYNVFLAAFFGISVALLTLSKRNMAVDR